MRQENGVMYSFQYAEIRPATSISATEGTWTAVWLDDKHNNSNVTKCYVSIARVRYMLLVLIIKNLVSRWNNL